MKLSQEFEALGIVDLVASIPAAAMDLQTLSIAFAVGGFTWLCAAFLVWWRHERTRP